MLFKSEKLICQSYSHINLLYLCELMQVIALFFVVLRVDRSYFIVVPRFVSFAILILTFDYCLCFASVLNKRLRRKRRQCHR